MSDEIPIPVLVLAAGAGTRLPGQVPKPFRQVYFAGEQLQMWEQAIASLHTIPARVHVAIQRADSLFFLSSLRRQAAELIQLEPTRGQADTLLQGLKVM